MKSINAKQMNVNELSNVTGGKVQFAPKRKGGIVYLLDAIIKKVMKSEKSV